MRKLATIVEIATCEPIHYTDRLSVATIKGKKWLVVVGRNEFRAGDIAVFLEFDASCTHDPFYAALSVRFPNRFIEQGSIIPLHEFPEIMRRIVRYRREEMGESKFESLIGTDVLITETKEEYYNRIRDTEEHYKAEHNEDYPCEWKEYFVGDHCVPVLGADVTSLIHYEAGELKSGVQEDCNKVIAGGGCDDKEVESHEQVFCLVEVAKDIYLVSYSMGTCYMADGRLYATNAERYGKNFEIVKETNPSINPDELQHIAIQFKSTKEACQYIERHGTFDDFCDWCAQLCKKYGGDPELYPKIKKVHATLTADLGDEGTTMIY